MSASKGEFPVGGGEMGKFIRAFDWAETDLGPIESWSGALRTATNIVLQSPLPLVMLWGPNGIMIYNDAYSVFAGKRHPRLLGSKVLEGWAEVADFNAKVLEVGLAGGTLSFKDQELTLFRNNVPEQVWMDLNYGPVLGEDGKPHGVLAIVVETTARVKAEAGVKASEERFRALVNATSDVVYRMNPDWREMQQLDGRGLLSDRQGPSIAWLDAHLFPEDQPQVQTAIAAAIREKKPFQLEHRVRRQDGSEGWTFSRAVPLLNEAGDIAEWFGAATDVTARRKAEEHLRLVINELNHRVKNMLAMMHAIAAQTFRRSDDLAAAHANFSARIKALADASDLLTGERWVGVSLKDTAEKVLRPYHADAPQRRVIRGSDVQLTPKTAISFSMALHELATNATKYGAWSGANGTVTVEWDVVRNGSADRLRFEWRESGGPTVIPPQSKGFGSRLVERGLAAELGGETRLDFQPDGVVFRIDAPLSLYADDAQ